MGKDTKKEGGVKTKVHLVHKNFRNSCIPVNYHLLKQPFGFS